MTGVFIRKFGPRHTQVENTMHRHRGTDTGDGHVNMEVEGTVMLHKPCNTRGYRRIEEARTPSTTDFREHGPANTFSHQLAAGF